MRPTRQHEGITVLDLTAKENFGLAMAARALQTGEASPEQQRIFFDALLNDICRVKDLSFRPGSDRLTAFYEGRRFVGMEVAGMITAKIKQEVNDE